MQSNEEELNRKLIEIFKEEAREHISVLSVGFIELERMAEEQRSELLEKLSRQAHTFKGAARTVEYHFIETTCRYLESILLAWKQGELVPDKNVFDILHRALDLIRASLEGENRDKDFVQLIEELESIEAKVSQTKGRKKNVAGKGAYDLSLNYKKDLLKQYGKNFLGGMIKLPAEQLETFLIEAEEFIPLKNAYDETFKDVLDFEDELQSLLFDCESFYTDKDDSLDRLKIREVIRKLDLLKDRLRQNTYAFSSAINQHLWNVKKAGVEPFSELTESFYRIVRDLSRQQNKEVTIEVTGESIELDRRMLQELQTPFLHLIRNAVDHGIETPKDRVAEGKNPVAKLSIFLSRIDSAKFEISIKDDGRGIEIEPVRKEIIKQNLVTKEQAEKLTDREVLDMIFKSGISTREGISDLSGRGLGLAIVRESVEKLSGQVWVESTLKKGTVFRIILPTSVSTLRCILIEAGGYEYYIPSAYVKRVVRYGEGEIKKVDDAPVYEFESTFVSVMNLSEILDLNYQKANEKKSSSTAVILNFAGRHIALKIDAVLDAKEIVVRDLGPQLFRVRMIAGATISGSGKVTPILNVGDIFTSDKFQKKATQIDETKQTQPSSSEIKTVLVVEDSITARSLLKSILESSDFRVKTAIDGTEAYTVLKTEKVDIVVSDIEMPRMNGFELTRKIRQDANLKRMPVVLISALESREDIEHGIEAGANAYIVKSRFEKTNLVDTIKDLV
ncbi:response regulator [Chitinispirillales bacterium ANBcel5]|uniref:hybrid sensor histidine kinase/response regulator n=1 Tax=Cellulosispirillum alkaliphilum TaxID=3039283 RepID=UPI002A527718|nr:response regulator [Chitinispirillales bacterium ANBcel5]